MFNEYVSNNRAPNYVRQKPIEPQAEVDESSMEGEDVNTLTAETDRPSRRKISKDVVKLGYSVHQSDMLSTVYVIQQQLNTHSSQAHGMFNKIDNILGHETHLNKCLKIETIDVLFPQLQRKLPANSLYGCPSSTMPLANGVT